MSELRSQEEVDNNKPYLIFDGHAAHLNPANLEFIKLYFNPL